MAIVFLSEMIRNLLCPNFSFDLCIISKLLFGTTTTKKAIDGFSFMLNIWVKSIQFTRHNTGQELTSLSSAFPLIFSSSQLQWFLFDPSPCIPIYLVLEGQFSWHNSSSDWLLTLTHLHCDVFNSKNNCGCKLLGIYHMLVTMIRLYIHHLI